MVEAKALLGRSGNHGGRGDAQRVGAPPRTQHTKDSLVYETTQDAAPELYAHDKGTAQDRGMAKRRQSATDGARRRRRGSVGNAFSQVYMRVSAADL